MITGYEGLQNDERLRTDSSRREYIMFIITIVLAPIAVAGALLLNDLTAAVYIGIILTIGLTVYFVLAGDAEWNEKIRAKFYRSPKPQPQSEQIQRRLWLGVIVISGIGGALFLISYITGTSNNLALFLLIIGAFGIVQALIYKRTWVDVEKEAANDGME